MIRPNTDKERLVVQYDDARVLTMKEAAAILHMSREEFRHVMWSELTPIHRDGKIYVNLGEFIAWRKRTMT